MKFRPLHDRVMIRRVDPEGKTTGGITAETREKIERELKLL